MEDTEPIEASPKRDKNKPKFRPADQSVCNEPGEMNGTCGGHLKHFSIAPRELTATLREGHILFRCQRCGQLYKGKPIGHIR